MVVFDEGDEEFPGRISLEEMREERLAKYDG